VVFREMSVYRVRIRGIYATALTVMLHRKGYIIVDMSKVLQQKIDIPAVEAPAHATVKSLGDKPDTILVFGYPWEAGESVFNTLIDELQYVTIQKSVYGNNTIVSALLQEHTNNSCVYLLPNKRKITVKGDQCSDLTPGNYYYLTIIHDSPDGKIIAKPGLRLVGDYVIVSYPGRGVSFSEHIKDPDLKADLLMTAGFSADLDNYHVHFRSNSRLGKLPEIEDEIKRLTVEIENLNENTPTQLSVVKQGEFLGFITLPSVAKLILDEYRKEARPTITYHHTLKSFGDTESLLVDCAENASKLSGKPSPDNGLAISYFLLERSHRGILFDHIKPNGKTIRLGPFNLVSARITNDSIEVELDRVFTKPGILDGLGLEKEPGDRAVTKLNTRNWYLIHEYYTRDGDLLGVYANINTPPEIGHGRIKYIDLLVDVVKKVGKPAEIIDREEIDNAYNEGLISEKLYHVAIKTAEKLVNKLNSEYD